MRVLITGGNGNIAKMIRNNLSFKYEIVAPARAELNILSFSEVKNFLENNDFDILVHTAISGGRRTKDENGDVTHFNLLMWENILKYADRFKMIINLDSGAIYDRSTDILNRSEDDIFTVPNDYYGFSKYLIYQRSLQYKNVFNFRIFNIFHINEEKDRFIKACFLAKKNGTDVNIFEDKYFDFMYEDDFVKIVDFYFENVLTPEKLQKTINICYDDKYKLSQIAEFVFGSSSEQIKVVKNELNNNYCGKNTNLKKLNINLSSLKESLLVYESRLLI